MPVRILVADDHEIVREGIRTLIARSRPEWEICGEAENGEDTIEMAKDQKPDVIILDITMPKMSGLETATRVAALKLGVRVLMFTMHDSTRLQAEARQASAQGVVLKSQAARDLIRAIDILLAGGTFFGPEPEQDSVAGDEPSSSTLESNLGRTRDRFARGAIALVTPKSYRARMRSRNGRRRFSSTAISGTAYSGGGRGYEQGVASCWIISRRHS